MAVVNIDNRYSSALAIIAGAILTLTRPVLSNLVPEQAQNPWAKLFSDLSTNGVTIFWILAGILSILVQVGGVTILLGGTLCYTNHLRLGKELVGFGTTFGLVDLLSSIPLSHQEVMDPLCGLPGLGCFARSLRIDTSKVQKTPMLERCENCWFLSGPG